jgi:hypothetical protein
MGVAPMSETSGDTAEFAAVVATGRAAKPRRRRRGIALAVVVAVVVLVIATPVAQGNGLLGRIDFHHLTAGALSGNPKRWPVGDGSESPDASSVLGWYQIVDAQFVEHPDDWGGAFMDGDSLVVNSVRRTGPQAVTALRALGVGNGVFVQEASISLAKFDRLGSAVVTDRALGPMIASVGPDYRTGELVVGVRDGGDLAAAEARLQEVLRQQGAGSIPYRIERGGTPGGAARGSG